ncbi:GFA family protein [Oceanicoccus sp. KOV_DT_Chl]|uniref:GFA family protein n=1 Tax=Oceanicoccus sp. KOV_DT_Chl TaxID=1904639 RepID=UPI000C7C8957|nr:GFA family protein [Oceanicoccus sp. KOV_DT_Chl]
MPTYPQSGRCQCDAIQYQVDEPFLFQVQCHCNDCQKYSATAFGISAFIPQTSFHITKGTPKKWSRPADSGGTVDCYFCGECGNRIYHHNPNKPELIKLKPGTLDDVSVIQPQMHVWVRSKQPWVEIPAGVEQHQTQPEF